MELSEEEKKAIERLKLFEYRYVLVQNDDKVIETILYLTEKLQQIIEEEKQYSDFYKDLCNKQQKELKNWFEIADKILRATNDYGNITIGYIPKYIDKLQKNIEELMKINTPMSWEMKDKDGNVIVSLKKPDDYISKDKIREKRNEIQSYAFTSEEEKSKQDYAIARFNELLEEN